jgi:hypothetical protein
VSALDDLSPVARHALWVGCMSSNVPVQIEDQTTVERISALLRSAVSTNSKAGTFSAPAPLRSTTVRGARLPKKAPDGSPPNGVPL